MRPSAIHAVAGAVLCSAATGFQEIAPTSLHPHTSSSSRGSFGPLHLASRANDNGGGGGSGRRSPGYVPFDGSGGPSIPGRGSKADDDEWFARQVQMAETERNGGGFGSRQMRSSQPRTSVTPPPAAPRASSARTTRTGIRRSDTKASAAAATATPPNRSNEPWPTIGTPTQQSTNRATAASTTNRAATAARAASAAAAADRNSRAPQAVASGSSANSSWFRGGNRSSPQGVQMPGAEQVQTPTEPMARLSGPRPVTKASAASPVSRAPITPGEAMRADADARSAGGAAAGGTRTGTQQQQQQPERPKSSGNWFNDQLQQQQLERERQQAIEAEFGGRPRPGAGGGGNRNIANSGTNRNRPSAGFPSLPQPIGSKDNRRGLPNLPDGLQQGLSTTPSQRQNMLAYAQSAFVGAFVGTWSIFPITAFHYLVFSDYTYTTFAQWEWDLIAASVQASCFAVIFRYSMRLDLDNKWIQRKVTLAAVLLRSVVRVTVPYECAAGKDQPLFCVDAAPLYVLSDSMTAEIAMNAVEGLAMFGMTALAMSWLLERNKIAPYRGD